MNRFAASMVLWFCSFQVGVEQTPVGEATPAVDTAGQPPKVSNPFLKRDKPSFGCYEQAPSWAYKKATHANEFAKRGLPPRDDEGVLILELSDLHSDGLREHDILINIAGVQIDSKTSYDRAMGRLSWDEPVRVAVRRVHGGGAGQGVWKTLVLTVKPVSTQAANILARRRKYVARMGPAITEQQAIADASGKLARVMLTSAVVTPQAYADATERFRTIAQRVAQGGNREELLGALAEMPVEACKVVDGLIHDTDWGRLRCVDHDKTNIEVWVGAWDVVLESLAEHGRVPQNLQEVRVNVPAKGGPPEDAEKTEAFKPEQLLGICRAPVDGSARVTQINELPANLLGVWWLYAKPAAGGRTELVPDNIRPFASFLIKAQSWQVANPGVDSAPERFRLIARAPDTEGLPTHLVILSADTQWLIHGPVSDKWILIRSLNNKNEKDRQVFEIRR